VICREPPGCCMRPREPVPTRNLHDLGKSPVMPIVSPARRICAAVALVCIPAIVHAGEPPAAGNGNPADARPQAAATGKADLRVPAFDELVASFIREHKIPGAAVAIMRHGRLIYARGFGLGDIEANEAVRPDSLFRIASVSKPITAVAVLQLVEQGKLGLDDRAFERLDGDPAFTPHGTPDPRTRQVTIRQLLRHTGGGWPRHALASLFPPAP